MASVASNARTKSVPESAQEPNLGRELELAAYKDMLLIRRFEEKAGQLYGMGLIGGFCHLYIGQEAVVVGMQMAMKPGDQVITGYRGTPDTTLAMERGELQGMGDWSWSNVKTRRPDYLRDNKVRVLLQVGVDRIADLPNVPMASDLVRNEDDRKVMNLFLAQKAAARPVAAPPDIPADRVKALRDAFARMIVDDAFNKDAASQKLDIEPTTASEIDKVIQLFATTPDSVGQRLKDAIEPK